MTAAGVIFCCLLIKIHVTFYQVALTQKRQNVFQEKSKMFHARKNLRRNFSPNSSNHFIASMDLLLRGS